jgi:hypothetical protein
MEDVMTTRLVILRLLTAVGIFVGVPVGAAAQQTANPWGAGSALNLFGGASVGDSHTGGAVGFAATWEATRWVGLEAEAIWLNRGPGADATALNVKLLANLVPRQKIVPFVTAGGGLYHASFDASRAATRIPGFYMRRAHNGMAAGFRTRSFNDAALALGGGVNVFLSRHIAVRPDFEILIVPGAGRNHVVGVLGFRLAYHFEEHPVTP